MSTVILGWLIGAAGFAAGYAIGREWEARERIRHEHRVALRLADEFRLRPSTTETNNRPDRSDLTAAEVDIDWGSVSNWGAA